MATLEALDELFNMGFLIEEEYVARRTALGAPPPKKKPAEPVSDPYGIPSTSSDPYYTIPDSSATVYHPYSTTYPTQPAQDAVSASDHSISSYEPPVNMYGHDSTPTSSYEAYLYGNSATTPEIAHVEVAVDAPSAVESVHDIVDPLSALPGVSQTGSNEPKPFIDTKAEHFPTGRIEIDITSFPNLHVPRAPDTSQSDTFLSIPSGQSLIVCRTIGAYRMMLVDASTSTCIVLQQFNLLDGFKLFEVGTVTKKVEREMYWTTASFVDAPNAETLASGKIYVVRRIKQSYSQYYFSSDFDERVILRELRKTLERAPLGRTDTEEYCEPHRIPDVRTFDGQVAGLYFDPRDILQYLAKHVKTEERRVPGRTTRVRVKTVATPSFMLWPILIGQLRAMEAKVREDQTRHLPQDAEAIWKRIEKCIETQTCYFTGQTTANSETFLCDRLHNNEVWELYKQIKSTEKQPRGFRAISTPDRLTEQLNAVGVNPDVYTERIAYDQYAKKRSYGWPKFEDTNSRPMKTLYGVKPISARRQHEVSMLVSRLASLNGPEPTMDA